MPKRDSGGADSIPRMLKMAFQCANEGDEAKAWNFWETAIRRGYQVQPKTERQLRLTIARGLRDRGLTPPASRDANAAASCAFEERLSDRE